MQYCSYVALSRQHCQVTAQPPLVLKIITLNDDKYNLPWSSHYTRPQQPPSGEETGPRNMGTEPPQPFLEELTEEVAFLRDCSTADTHSGEQEGLGDKHQWRGGRAFHSGRSSRHPSCHSDGLPCCTQNHQPQTEDCKSFFMKECELHGTAYFVPDIPAPLGVPDRARHTLPSGLEVRTSGIPEAGLGVFNQGNTVPAGAHYGPYEGEITDKDRAMESGYSWVIFLLKHIKMSP
uniref:SET domain-containing protein n=1 Tax=Hucho hucho TaxID=62062 RepID=A0A4W5R7D3_9TELE